jgi:hypothetical protein
VRKERLAVCLLAVALVLLRSAVPVLYEGYFFDSDQAIVGLMARHISRFQDFPLFFYGQNYMLGVQAWIIAPVFWVMRPSVAAMRVPFVLLNCVVAVWLIAAISRAASRSSGILRRAVRVHPAVVESSKAAGGVRRAAGIRISPS